ncbi:MAG TPA: acyltransferase, partial [Thermomicrobiales bacterium]|nr:acyltransferase [Thermomicrobiales bacterium]
SWILGYRPALDGLRGIAVLLVIVQHTKLTPFDRLGVAGVTLFFVLSGFLITTLLLEEQRRTGAINLAAFYWRRARRLLPALGVFLLAMALVGGASVVIPAALYYANWHFTWAEYPEPLVHLWTLSVEEQFYLVWPIALLGLVAIPRRFAVGVLVALIAGMTASRIAFELAAATHETVFYATQHRADSILAGCVLAFGFERRAWVPSPVLVIVAVGLLALAGTMAHDVFVSLFGLPLATAGAVVVTALGATRGARLLAWRPLVYLGTISYGLYLWHYPIIWPAIGGSWIVPAVVAAVGVAAVSYRFIERPILRWHTGSARSDSARAKRHDESVREFHWESERAALR